MKRYGVVFNCKGEPLATVQDMSANPDEQYLLNNSISNIITINNHLIQTEIADNGQALRLSLIFESQPVHQTQRALITEYQERLKDLHRIELDLIALKLAHQNTMQQSREQDQEIKEDFDQLSGVQSLHRSRIDAIIKIKALHVDISPQDIQVFVMPAGLVTHLPTISDIPLIWCPDPTPVHISIGGLSNNQSSLNSLSSSSSPSSNASAAGSIQVPSQLPLVFVKQIGRTVGQRGKGQYISPWFAWSKDGTRIVSGTGAGVLSIWDVTCQGEAGANASASARADINIDGDDIKNGDCIRAISNQDQCVKIRDISPINRGHGGQYDCLSWNSHNIIACGRGRDNNVYLYDSKQGISIGFFDIHDDTNPLARAGLPTDDGYDDYDYDNDPNAEFDPYSNSFSTDGISCIAWSNQTHVYPSLSTMSSSSFSSSSSSQSKSQSQSQSPREGFFLALTDNRGYLHIWDVHDVEFPRQIQRVHLSFRHVAGLAWSWDDTFLSVYGAEAGSLCIYSVGIDQQERKIDTENGEKYVNIGNTDYNCPFLCMELLPFQDYVSTSDVQPSPQEYKCMAWSPNNCLAMGTRDQQILIWQCGSRPKAKENTYDGEGNTNHSNNHGEAYGIDNKGSGDGSCNVPNPSCAESGGRNVWTCVGALPSPDGRQPTHISFGLDGAMAVCAQSIQIWNIEAQECLGTLTHVNQGNSQPSDPTAAPTARRSGPIRTPMVEWCIDGRLAALHNLDFIQLWE